MNAVKVISWILVIIGGLNWGLVGLFGLDVVAYLPSVVARIVYILVGLGAVVLLVTKKSSKASAPMSSQPQM